MTNDPAFYDNALRRVQRIGFFLGAIGAATMFAAQGWRSGAGFLTGSAISMVNFWWWKHLVNAIGESGVKPRRASAVLLGARYLLLGIGVYVIVKLLGVSLTAILTGLFVAVAAVTIEILYELIFT